MRFPGTPPAKGICTFEIEVMNATRNTLPAAVRKTAVQVLNGTVANLFDLYARTKQAHWNVRGQSFFALHKLLDEFAAAIEEHVDAAAERATALGGIVEGTLRDAVRHSRLKKKEEPSSKSGQRDWIRELADVPAACGQQVRAAIKKLTDAEDFGTADLLTDVLRSLDKQLWILEAHLNK